MKEFLEEYYVCGKCKSEDITLMPRAGGSVCYRCNNCKRIACVPRVMFRLKYGANWEKMEDIYGQMLEKSLKGRIHVTGALANVIAVVENVKQGKKPKTRKVKDIVYKDGKCIEIKKSRK